MYLIYFINTSNTVEKTQETSGYRATKRALDFINKGKNHICIYDSLEHRWHIRSPENTSWKITAPENIDPQIRAYHLLTYRG